MQTRKHFEKLVDDRRGYVCPFCQKLNMLSILTTFLGKIDRSLEMESKKKERKKEKKKEKRKQGMQS